MISWHGGDLRHYKSVDRGDADSAGPAFVLEDIDAAGAAAAAITAGGRAGAGANARAGSGAGAGVAALAPVRTGGTDSAAISFPRSPTSLATLAIRRSNAASSSFSTSHMPYLLHSA